MEMAVRGSYFAYRFKLTARSRKLRRQPTPAETKLWFDFLRRCPAKHDASRDASLRKQGLRIVRFTNEDVMQRFEAVCVEIAAILDEPRT